MKITNFIILSTFFISLSLIGQVNKESYNWFDNQIGIENTGLYNGIEYIEVEKGSNNYTKFLYPDNFSSGFVSYDGQTYFDVLLKYNVYEEKVIANVGQISGKKVFEIFAAKIDSFSIENRKFIQSKILISEEGKQISGFNELLIDGKQIKLFKKLRKNKNTKINNKTLLFEYKWAKPAYFIQYNGKMFEVRKRNDFIDIFPEFKTQLRDIDVKRAMIKTNPDSDVITYTNKINSLLSN